MLLHCGLLLICLNYVRTTDYIYDYGLGNSATEWNRRFSYWPSLHNALARLQKRDIPIGGQSEGGSVQNIPAASVNPSSPHPVPPETTSAPSGVTPIKTAAVQTTSTPSHEPSASNDIPNNPKTELPGSPKGILFHIVFIIYITLYLPIKNKFIC